MNAGISARHGACAVSATAGKWPISRNSCKSAGRALATMKARNGSAAFCSASSSAILPCVIGKIAPVHAWSIAGCMTKNVRNNASPISTIFGGVPCAPSAPRSSVSTTIMRVNAVTITNRLGARESTVNSAVICTRRPVAPASPACPRSTLNDCAAATTGSSNIAAAISQTFTRRRPCPATP